MKSKEDYVTKEYLQNVFKTELKEELTIENKTA
jgi:hypothetical protein